jgi:hypothetical protein
VNTQVRGADEAVGVLINEAGDHQSAWNLEDLIAIGSQGWSYLYDPAGPTPDVVAATRAGVGIQDLPALENKTGHVALLG